jgi:hypothetical protein
MTSPYGTGGGGTHLEARVAASCLAAVLCEGSIRGLPGEFATRVLSQRAAFGDPLDDLIIDGVHSDGRKTQLHLQVKNKLTFTENDDEWVGVLKRAWDSVSKSGFDSTCQRVGVGIGTFNARVEQHYQSIFNWAEHSTDAAHFFERIEQGDYSHQDKQSFVATVQAILEPHAKRELTDDELWRFLKVFVITHYDFQSGPASRDAANVIDRLKGILPPERRDQASGIWDHLVAKAGEMLPVGGGATRATLKEALSQDGITVGAAPSFWKDIQSLQLESERALGDIKSDIQGLKLHRAAAYEEVRQALVDGRFVQIDGEPGTGKSAVLKEIAEESARNGPVLVLKDTRIRPQGWSAHAHELGVSGDIAALLREFACAGEPILFIDGIDKITDPAVQLTVNDVLRSIANDEGLADWRVLVTIREQNLRHLETWLDSDALKKLPLRTILVQPLDSAELALVAQTFPRLRPLLAQSGGPDIILRRPFFLNALLSLVGSAGQLPATEVELLKLWWEMGGSDRKEFSPAQYRRNLLQALAEALCSAPNKEVSIRDLPPEPVEELKSAGVLRDKVLGHSVVFTHDIYEEWTLCEYLIGQQSGIAALLAGAGEPDILIRPMQLLGAYVLETSANPDAWKAFLDSVSAAALRPVWQRTVLTLCLQSTRTTQLLQKVTDYLFANDGEQLRKLMLAMTTIEVLPNPLFLNEQLTRDLEPEERARYAHILAIPKGLTWIRFLDWLMPHMPTLPPTLIPDVLPVFMSWQDQYAGGRVRHCRQIGEISYGWLKEIENCTHPRDFRKYRTPFGGALSGRDAKKSVRALFLISAGSVPELATEYLQGKAADRDHAHMFLCEILRNSVPLGRYVPSALVDFLLAVLLEDLDDESGPFGTHSVIDDPGIADHREFYPASPMQPPFLNLLRLHPDQGLRLIRGLSNHAVASWRVVRERGRRYSQPVAPVPVSLTFPWGVQSFWGDGQVYLWFRGVWGNDAVESALMALEQWALEQLDKGAVFDDIFRKVIEGNDAVAALGIGVSLCLAHPDKSLQCAYPLLTCPYLWEWDSARIVFEHCPTNAMGNWYQDRVYLSAVRALNERPHRKQALRELIPYFIYSADEALLEAYTKDIRSFPDRLPISYEEEKADANHMAGLHKKMTLFAEQGDPQYFKAAQTKDGKHIQIWSEPPSLEKDEYKEQQQRHLLLNEYLGVAMWANKSLESGNLDERFPIQDGLAKARNWDEPDLFDTRTGTMEERHRASAVAGAAYVAAKYSAPGDWTDELAAWCLNVIERAATGPENLKEVNVRNAVLLMHPAVIAAHGYSALLARGVEPERCQVGLLNLVVDALQAVQVAVLASAKYYAAQQPVFYWILLNLAIEQCVVGRDDIVDYHSIEWEKRESDRKVALLDRAEALLRSKETPPFPTIPMPWKKVGKSSRREWRDTKGYARNNSVFLYDLGEKMIPEICLEAILGDADRHGKFLTLVSELLEYSFQEVVPPFATSKRDYRGNVPFEWVYRFSAWCGGLCARLTYDEAKSILTRIWGRDTETALLMLQSVMRVFMIRAFLRPTEISDEHLALWSEMTDWLFKSPEWIHNSRRDHLDREFTYCAFASLFCFASDLGPLVCGVEPAWPHLRKFLPVIQRAICEFGVNVTLYLAVTTFLKRGGMDLMPEPSLAWLRSVVEDRKADQNFWESNGENTVEVLKLLISQKGNLLTADHRKSITLIADILIDNGVRGAGFLQQELLRAA